MQKFDGLGSDIDVRVVFHRDLLFVRMVMPFVSTFKKQEIVFQRGTLLRGSGANLKLLFRQHK
jgi:hypothetical protein